MTAPCGCRLSSYAQPLPEQIEAYEEEIDFQEFENEVVKGSWKDQFVNLVKFQIQRFHDGQAEFDGDLEALRTRSRFQKGRRLLYIIAFLVLMWLMFTLGSYVAVRICNNPWLIRCGACGSCFYNVLRYDYFLTYILSSGTFPAPF